MVSSSRACGELVWSYDCDLVDLSGVIVSFGDGVAAFGDFPAAAEVDCDDLRRNTIGRFFLALTEKDDVFLLDFEELLVD